MDLGKLKIKKDCFSPEPGSLHLVPWKCSDLLLKRKHGKEKEPCQGSEGLEKQFCL